MQVRFRLFRSIEKSGVGLAIDADGNLVVTLSNLYLTESGEQGYQAQSEQLVHGISTSQTSCLRFAGLGVLFARSGRYIGSISEENQCSDSGRSRQRRCRHHESGGVAVVFRDRSRRE